VSAKVICGVVICAKALSIHPCADDREEYR
jgi:hypothetical protein